MVVTVPCSNPPFSRMVGGGDFLIGTPEIERNAAVVRWIRLDVESTVELAEVFDERGRFSCLHYLPILIFESGVNRLAEDFPEVPTEERHLVHLVEFLSLRIDECELPIRVHFDDGIRYVLDDGPELLMACSDFLAGPVMFDGVGSGVCQHGITIRGSLLLKIIGDPCRNRLTRNFFGALPGEQDEWKIGTFVSNLLQELNTVTAGHFVIRNNAVERFFTKFVQAVAGPGRLHDLESIVLTL